MIRETLKAFEVPCTHLIDRKPKHRLRKLMTVPVMNERGRKTWWTRSELKQLLGRTRKPMPESTFKTRLALLEEYCPESEHRLYTRKFPDFTKWALLTIEGWLRETNYNMTAIQQKLENTGLPTHEYFNPKN